MRKMLTFLENGNLTAAETAIDWDNKLRKINLTNICYLTRTF